jgi:hypothetical protein
MLSSKKKKFQIRFLALHIFPFFLSLLEVLCDPTNVIWSYENSFEAITESVS